MRNYLTLIRRSDFIDLFKYGFFYLYTDRIVEFDGNVNDLPHNKDVYHKLFNRINSFESSFAYLVIHFINSEDVSDPAFLKIEDIRHVFPLDLEAKREFELSFDEHIRICNPVWPNVIRQIKKRELFQSSMEGARIIFRLYQLQGFDDCKDVISDEAIKEMLSDLYDGVYPSANAPIWAFLMRYQRHSFYPKETLGYFMDTVHVYMNYSSKREVGEQEVESTEIYKLLYSYRGRRYKVSEILALLEKEASAMGFLTKTKAITPGLNYILIAVHYLILRDRFKEGFTYVENDDWVMSSKSYLGDNFKIVAYLIGITLGREKTYSALYECLPLHIYKSKEEIADIQRYKKIEQEKARRDMARVEQERAYELQKKNKSKRMSKHSPGISGQRIPQETYGKDSYLAYQDCSSNLHHGNKKDCIRECEAETIESTHKRSMLDTKPVPADVEENKTGISTSNMYNKNRSVTGPLFTEESVEERRYPLILNRYTKKGKLWIGGGIKTVELNNEKEYEKFMKEHSEEIWK